MGTEREVTCRQFANFLIARAEHLDTDIMHDVMPWEPWLGDVSTGSFGAYDGVEHTFDRLGMVYPDLTGAWTDLPNTSCIGSPCDPDAKEVCYGYTRDSYKLQRRSYKSQLFCWDQMMTYDRAIQQMADFTANLREVSKLVVGDRMRLEAFRISGTRLVANAAMTPLVATWNADMTELTINAVPTSCLTGEMLMRQYQPLCNNGYFGRNPTGTNQYVVCKTDLDSMYRINAAAANTNNRWQFAQFGQGAEQFFKYGWSGQIGNFVVKAELWPLRFNIKQTNADGSAVLQRVFPYRNIAGSQGLVRESNPDFLDARVQWSQVAWHVQAMKILGFDPTPVNPEMPFTMRDLAGKWQFAMHDLGMDSNGCIIENPRGNKGMFLADFVLGTKAERPEWAVGILHLREQTQITIDPPDSDDPGYPEQTYNSACDPCESDLDFTPVLGADGNYGIAANTIRCNGIPIVHGAISEATIAALLIALNADANLAALGEWIAGDDDTTITLDDSHCPDVTITWLA